MQKILVIPILFMILLFSACGGSSEEVSQSDLGQKVFKKYCSLCHGADGKLGLNDAGDLSASLLNSEARKEIIINGKNMMQPFKPMLSEAEIDAVNLFLESLKNQ